MIKISVVISAWNEEKKIERCLSALDWAHEIIVVDNASTDKTAFLAKKYTKHIYNKANNPMLNINKNYGFTKATGEWILCLDADEVITAELAREMIQAVTDATEQIAGFWIKRKNIIFGKWIRHGLWWPDTQLRLFRAGRGRFACKHVHEKLIIEGESAQLSEALIHHNYESISQFIRKMDTLYTESEVENLLSTGYQFSWFDAICFPVSDFIKVYFAQECYKDGLHGLVLSLLQAAYSLVVFAKLWERLGFSEKDVTPAAIVQEFSKSEKEMSYWLWTVKLQNANNYSFRLYYRFMRKLTSILHL